MNINNCIELIKKYSQCSKCGSVEISDEKGGIIIENNIIRRYCECGYNINLNSNGDEMNSINMSLEFPIEDLIKLRDFLKVQEWADIYEIIKKYKLDISPDDIEMILTGLYFRINEIL